MDIYASEIRDEQPRRQSRGGSTNDECPIENDPDKGGIPGEGKEHERTRGANMQRHGAAVQNFVRKCQRPKTSPVCSCLLPPNVGSYAVRIESGRFGIEQGLMWALGDTGEVEQSPAQPCAGHYVTASCSCPRPRERIETRAQFRSVACSISRTDINVDAFQR